MANFLYSAKERDSALKASGQTSFDTENLALQSLSGILAVIGGLEHEPVKSGGYGVQMIIDGLKGKDSRGEEALKKLRNKANPFFTANQVEIGIDSPVTQRYLTTRRWKKMAASGFQTIGDLASLAAPPANVPGALLHGQAAGLTGMHMLGLAAIAYEYRNSATVAGWCKLIASMKSAKLGVRGLQFAGTFVPAASLPSGIIAALMKAGIKNLTLVGACYVAAAQIHWFAYQEQGHFIEPRAVTTETPTPAMPSRQAVTRPNQTVAPINYSRPLPHPASAPVNYSRPLPQAALPPLVPNRRLPSPAEEVPRVEGPEAGPASKIFWEIFTRRGATRLLGAYEIGALVKEPAGWMALGDKLMLI